MSFKLLAWAQSVKTGSASTKAVLMAIVAIVNDDGEGFPSQQRIAEDSELSIRSVKRAMDELEKRGVITRERRYREGGYRTSDAIKVHTDAIISGATKSGDAESGDTVSNLRCHNGRAEPVIEPVSNKNTKRERKPKFPFPGDFVLSPQNYAIAVERGYTPDEIQIEIQRMRNWSDNADGSKGLKSDWQKFAFNWFTSPQKGKRNGPGNYHKPNSIDDIFGKLHAVNDEIERREQESSYGSG